LPYPNDVTDIDIDESQQRPRVERAIPRWNRSTMRIGRRFTDG
jgi:hypothetical protein